MLLIDNRPDKMNKLKYLYDLRYKYLKEIKGNLEDFYSLTYIELNKIFENVAKEKEDKSEFIKQISDKVPSKIVFNYPLD